MILNNKKFRIKINKILSEDKFFFAIFRLILIFFLIIRFEEQYKKKELLI